MGDNLVIGVFVLWACLSLLVLLPGVKRVLRMWDWPGLIPEWFFFAPRPAQGDYHLLYRDYLLDGGVTRWTEVQPLKKRRWWNIVWNPGRRERKALFDAVNELALLVRHNEKTIETTICYLMLLNHISTLPRLVFPQFTQFLLMQSYGRAAEKELRVLYLSGVHKL